MTTVTQPQTETKTQSQTPADLGVVKARQQVAWSTGDYAVIGGTLVLVAEALCEAANLRAGSRVLDVATGSGNAAIAAARYWCEVTGVDYVPSLLERARERLAAERLSATFKDGDAENLPCADAAFDVVLSTYGVMFAPDHAQAARELLRVCRSGGTVALANWTPQGFIGQVFKLFGQYVPPAAGVKSPMLWGTEDHLKTLFGNGVDSLRVTPRNYVFRYRSAKHWLETFRTYYGPAQKIFNALDAGKQTELERDMLNLADRFNQDAAALSVPSEYVEVIVIKR